MKLQYKLKRYKNNLVKFCGCFFFKKTACKTPQVFFDCKLFYSRQRRKLILELENKIAQWNDYMYAGSRNQKYSTYLQQFRS